jgi:hypothetical protein
MSSDSALSDSALSDSASVPTVVPAEPPSSDLSGVVAAADTVSVANLVNSAIDQAPAAIASIAPPEVKEAIATATAAVAAAVADPELADPELADDLKELLKLITDKLKNKPENEAEMTKLYHDLTMSLSTYLVKQLPPMEQKAALMALWAMEQVQTASVGCFGLRK